MELESRGIPTVLFAEENFEKPARAQARALGMPSLPVVVIAQPRPWHDDRFHRDETAKCLPEVVQALTAQPPEGGESRNK